MPSRLGPHLRLLPRRLSRNRGRYVILLSITYSVCVSMSCFSRSLSLIFLFSFSLSLSVSVSMFCCSRSLSLSLPLSPPSQSLPSLPQRSLLTLFSLTPSPYLLLPLLILLPLEGDLQRQRLRPGKPADAHGQGSVPYRLRCGGHVQIHCPQEHCPLRGDEGTDASLFVFFLFIMNISHPPPPPLSTHFSSIPFSMNISHPLLLPFYPTTLPCPSPRLHRPLKVLTAEECTARQSIMLNQYVGAVEIEVIQ